MPASVADRVQQARDVREPDGLAHERRVAEALEPGDVGRGIAALPGEDQIGLERDHALELDARGVSDLRNLARGRRIVAEARDADEAPARARGEGELGQARRERDDAAAPARPA